MIMGQLSSLRSVSVAQIVLFTLLIKLVTSSNKGPASVQCSRDAMTVRLPVAGIVSVTVDKWAGMPGCQFSTTGQHHELRLPLTEDLPCGLTRVTNTVSRKSLYYSKVRIINDDASEELMLVKCAPSFDLSTSHNIVRRDLPPEFVEPDFIEITSEVTGSAPIPLLGVGVRQEGALVDGEINVAPGTPLTMEVFLDDGSSSIYGILVSYLEVTDNANKKETIVYNGCTIDPNLFENFNTISGDFLSAKFRAFKFPESSYVLFRGTVDVCLDKCQGITCSDGKVGYGRRRRAVDGRDADPNKLFEVTMTTIIKFTNDTTSEIEERTAIFAEEVFNKAAAPSWEAPLTRRSPDSPPSVPFNAAASLSVAPLLTAITALLQLLAAAAVV